MISIFGGGIAFALNFLPGIIIPVWLWAAAGIVGVFIAQFWAYHRIRVERDNLKIDTSTAEQKEDATWKDFPITSNSTAITTGSGAVNDMGAGAILQTGNSACSSAILMQRTDWQFMGKAFGVTSWNKKFSFQMIFKAEGIPKGTSRFIVGEGEVDPSHEFHIDNGLGVHIDGNALKGITYDKGKGTIIDLKFTAVRNRVHGLILAKSRTKVEWILDGESKAKITGGPSGAFNVGKKCIIWCDVVNCNEGGNQRFNLQLLRIRAT